MDKTLIIVADVADELTEVLQVLNDAGKFFRDILRKNKQPFNVNDWVLRPLTFPDSWHYACENDKIKVNTKEAYRHEKGIRSYFGISRDNGELYFSLRIEYKSDIKALFKNAEHRLNFATRLAHQFLRNGMHISRTEYTQLLKKSGDLTNLRKIASIMEKWLEGDNYEKTVKWGEQLDQLRNDIPKEALQAPHTLYRLVIVKEAAFNKLINFDKPLILEDRRYSSWTTSVKAAQDFAQHRRAHEDEVKVILRKIFTSNKILVNVIPLMEYLLSSNLIEYIDDYIKEEKEVVVKNMHNDYKFTSKNIEYFQPYKERTWYRL